MKIRAFILSENQFRLPIFFLVQVSLLDFSIHKVERYISSNVVKVDFLRHLSCLLLSLYEFQGYIVNLNYIHHS